MKLYKYNKKQLGIEKISITELILLNIPISIGLFLIFILIGSSSPVKKTQIKVETIIKHDTLQQLVVLRSGLTQINLERDRNICKFCNNPGNIRPGNKLIDNMAIGTISSINGDFLYFPNEEQGFKALEYLLKTVYKNYTIEECIQKYAPSMENNTQNYIEILTNSLKVPKTTKVKDINIKKLSKTIAKIEGYY